MIRCRWMTENSHFKRSGIIHSDEHSTYRKYLLQHMNFQTFLGDVFRKNQRDKNRFNSPVEYQGIFPSKYWGRTSAGCSSTCVQSPKSFNSFNSHPRSFFTGSPNISRNTLCNNAPVSASASCRCHFTASPLVQARQRSGAGRGAGGVGFSLFAIIFES